jgi:hypothetical protein
MSSRVLFTLALLLPACDPGEKAEDTGLVDEGEDGGGDEDGGSGDGGSGEGGDEAGDEGGDGAADRDGDGVPDDEDASPDDPAEWEDSDGDGVGDNADLCEGDDATGDLDGDGLCDDQDEDRDGDGTPDDEDEYPDDASASTTYVLISDALSDAVHRYRAADGTHVDEFIPQTDTGGTYSLTRPWHFAVRDGSLYVADQDSHSVLRFDAATGAYQDVFVAPGEGGLRNPAGMLFNADDELIVVSWNGSGGCSGDGALLRYDSGGAFIEEHASLDYRAHWLAQHPDGDLYVPYYCGEGIEQFDADGTFVDRHGDDPIISGRIYDLVFEQTSGNPILSLGYLHEADASDWSMVTTYGGDFIGAISHGPEGLYAVDYHPSLSPTPTLRVYDTATGTESWNAPLAEMTYPDRMFIYAGL